MLYVSMFLLFFLSVAIYRRYYPINGIPCIHDSDRDETDVVVLDIRDYNEAGEFPVANSLHIPYAYLKRLFSTIPNKPIHVVAQDEVEKNLGIRFLLRHGFHVKSYSLACCPCYERREKKWNIAKKSNIA
jgi:rhodanese-related sulfurtransferase